MQEREEGIERLYPSIFGRMASRFYYLRQLRLKIEEVISLFIIPNPEKLILADYGCGNMPYQQLILPHVQQYIGIDLFENPRADIHISDEGNIDLANESLDIVLSTQVLEHVVNPFKYLNEAHRVLNSGGKLILSTHGYWMFHPDPTDFWRWTSAGLTKIVTEAGFEIVYFKGIIGRSAMGLQLFQDGLLFKLPKFLRPVLAIIMQPLIIFFDKTTSASTKDKDACTFILVAKKIK